MIWKCKIGLLPLRTQVREILKQMLCNMTCRVTHEAVPVSVARHSRSAKLQTGLLEVRGWSKSGDDPAAELHASLPAAALTSETYRNLDRSQKFLLKLQCAVPVALLQ